jgi:hypothetical protein
MKYLSASYKLENQTYYTARAVKDRKRSEKMKIKFDVGNFILAIIGLSVSLLIFANLAPSGSN